ncbi:MAG: sensor histidine kinase, partial [Actinomycetota bacterium]
YMPVRASNGRQLLFEAYIPHSSVAAGGRRLWMAFAPALLGGLVLLELIQLPLAWSMARRLRTGQRQREALLQRAIHASDSERRRIASDLHDGVVQELAGLTFSLSAAASQVGPDAPAPLAGTLREAAAGTRQSMRKLRTLLVDIYPPNLHSAGLEAALADLAAPMTAPGREVKVVVPPDLHLSPAIESLLFRTAQEALRNVDAHSRARRVTVEASRKDGRVTLSVKDDGDGFSVHDLERRRQNGHLGLLLMGDLAADAGGELEIDSNVGAGTRLRLEVPVA